VLASNLVNFENLDISATSSSLYNLTGNNANNVLTGNNASNTLSGLVGADTISGGGGNDRIIGGKGSDSLRGDAGSDTFAFTAGDSGQKLNTQDVILDYTKGALGTGDVIDFAVALTIGGSSAPATSTNASIDSVTGIATFASGSGLNINDALKDIATRFTGSQNANGEFAFFKINETGDYFMFVSDGKAGVSANDVVIQLVGVTSISNIDLSGGNLTILA